MDQKLRNFYLENQIKNASPGQLLIMLYDGLIQNAESADTELSAKENPDARVQASRFVSRCIDIMTELNTCLRHSVDPKLCSTLSDLYRFFTHELSEAFDKGEPGRIRAILPLIRELRKAWFEADREANKFEVTVIEAVAA
jgi:flagellar protein FliS